jgi:hypothetical protein
MSSDKRDPELIRLDNKLSKKIYELEDKVKTLERRNKELKLKDEFLEREDKKLHDRIGKISYGGGMLE